MDEPRSLAKWLEWLEILHPTTIELGLERVRTVYDRLQLDFGTTQIVVVGGTNGKGSSVAMLSAVLRAAGYSVGTYTSPHLLVYNERVTLDDRMATDAELCSAFEAVEAARADVSLTYFEFGTLAAFVIFAERQPDFLILEVGLGGRLDAVNIIEPDVSIVTNVALDHVDWLGDTREKIGFEKAGIFRAGKPAIYGESDMPDSVRNTAQGLGANLLHKGEHYRWVEEGAAWCWLGSDKQGELLEIGQLPRNDFPLDNAAAVIQALQFLRAAIRPEHIREGLATIRVPGRFQQERVEGIDVILDVAHNPHAAAHLAGRLTAMPASVRVHLVLAMLGDKDSASVVKLLAPHAASIYLAPLGGERGAPVKIIYNHALSAGAATVTCHDDVRQAFRAALDHATQGRNAGLDTGKDVIVVTGSFFTVAAVLELI
jgi:dihydrofolate synthase / folylpolyglutamate synthase